MGYEHSGGHLQPVIKRLAMTPWRPSVSFAAEGTATAYNEAIGEETPRDMRVGCQRVVFPFGVWLTGWEYRISSVGAANFSTTAANVGTRIWLWNNSDSTYLPTSIVTGSDTGRKTLSTQRTAAGSDAETASSGAARCVLALPSTIYVPSGEYTLAFAVDKTYTSVPEATWSMSVQFMSYAPFGGSSSAAIRRPYGYEVAGGDLANYAIPSSRALGDFVDANAWGEAQISLVALCTGGP